MHAVPLSLGLNVPKGQSLQKYRLSPEVEYFPGWQQVRRLLLTGPIYDAAEGRNSDMIPLLPVNVSLAMLTELWQLKVTESKDKHDENALPHMTNTFLGTAKEMRLVQDFRAEAPIVCNLESASNVSTSKKSQFSNALSPILVTVSGMLLTACKPELANALFPIDTILLPCSKNM